MKEESKTRPWAALAVAVMFVLASLVSAAPARAAEERTVIPMGRAVGIKLFSDGVMVVGFSEVAGAEGSSAPARDCGLREGDIITHINREEVDSIEEVQSVLQEVGGKPMSIRAVRDDKTVQLTAQAVQCGSDGQYKLGRGSATPWRGSAPSPSASPLPGGSALWATASTTWTPPSSCHSSPAPSCIRRSPM